MTAQNPQGFLPRVRDAIARTDVSLDAATDASVEKQVLTLSSLAITVGAVVWGLVYLAFNEPWAAVVPLSYAAVTVITLVIAIETNGFEWYRDFQFVLVLVLPSILMAILGGFVPGSAVIIWALLTPIGALLSTEPRRASAWFGAYVVLVDVSIWAADLRSAASELPDLVIAIMFGMNLAVPTGITFLVVRKFVEQRDIARRLLVEEQQKSENLLLNVLPEDVAKQLKNNSGAIAEHYDSVSVLFADIVGFTPMSETLLPDQMVSTLNDVFSHFDTLAEEFGVEKIRTIGDSYMVASGLPVRRSDHAAALADMALAMRDFTADVLAGSPPIVFRIGINSGPAVAGVIGTSRYQYDIWGDTVNTASRMESHGVPGEIQVSAATRDLLVSEFEFRRHGTIEVKGKDAMETWILEARKSNATAWSR